MSLTAKPAASASSLYFPQGQKKPLSPSFVLRGTTWTCRCGTLWLTTVVDPATKLPARPEAGFHRPRQALDVREQRAKEGRRHGSASVLVVDARHDERVAGKERTRVEEGEGQLVL